MQVVLCRSCPSCSWGGLCGFRECMFAGQSSSGFPAGRLQIPAWLQPAWGKLMDFKSPKSSEKLKLKWNSCQGSYSAVVTMRSCVQEMCVSSLQIWWSDWLPSPWQTGFWLVSVSCGAREWESRLCPLPLKCPKSQQNAKQLLQSWWSWCGACESRDVQISIMLNTFRDCVWVLLYFKIYLISISHCSSLY